MPGPRDAIDSTVRIITPENIAFRYQLAGPTRRLGAFLIDFVIRGVVIGAMFFLTAFLDMGFVWGLFLICVFVVWWGYGALLETYWNGQTIGKRVLRIRVRSLSGRPIGGMQAFIRNLLRDADILPPLLGTVLPTGMLGLVAMSQNGRFQRLGDLVARTIVVVEERRWLHGLETLEDPRVYQLASYIPTDFQISRSLSQTLAMYVERRKYLGPARRREIAKPLCEPLLDRFGLPPDTSYDLLMCALYYRAFVGDRGDDEQYAEVAERALQSRLEPATPPVSEVFRTS